MTWYAIDLGHSNLVVARARTKGIQVVYQINKIMLNVKKIAYNILLD